MPEGRSVSRGAVRFCIAVLGCLCLTIVVSSAASIPSSPADESYRAAIEKWRQEREARLKADDGWLTVAGLFWLTEGENRFGADTLNDIVLPAGSAPPRAGVFEFRNGKTSVRIEPGVTVTLNGKPIQAADLRTGAVDTLAIGDLRMFVHLSGERYAIRLRDMNNRIRRDFAGLRWFPINDAFRVEGRFMPYEAPRKVQVPNILGDLENYTSPGEVEFSLQGQTFRMQAVTSGKRLWFIMRDLTSGRETCRSARFLYAEGTPDGKAGPVILDFNQTQNPPCAFNPYTTCPLPPEQNRLRVRVEAGEMDYQGRHATSEEE